MASDQLTKWDVGKNGTGYQRRKANNEQTRIEDAKIEESLWRLPPPLRGNIFF